MSPESTNRQRIVHQGEFPVGLTTPPKLPGMQLRGADVVADELANVNTTGTANEVCFLSAELALAKIQELDFVTAEKVLQHGMLMSNAPGVSDLAKVWLGLVKTEFLLVRGADYRSLEVVSIMQNTIGCTVESDQLFAHELFSERAAKVPDSLAAAWSRYHLMQMRMAATSDRNSLSKIKDEVGNLLEKFDNPLDRGLLNVTLAFCDFRLSRKGRNRGLISEAQISAATSIAELKLSGFSRLLPLAYGTMARLEAVSGHETKGLDSIEEIIKLAKPAKQKIFEFYADVLQAAKCVSSGLNGEAAKLVLSVRENMQTYGVKDQRLSHLINELAAYLHLDRPARSEKNSRYGNGGSGVGRGY